MKRSKTIFSAIFFFVVITRYHRPYTKLLLSWESFSNESQPNINWIHRKGEKKSITIRILRKTAMKLLLQPCTQ